MPLFIKTNSYGEYVFDWAWASAYESNGFKYYPKLLTAIPFTPSYGPRLFVNPQQTIHSSPQIVALVVDAVKNRAREIDASSWHILFPEQALHQQLCSAGLQARTACQFHWKNVNYASFDDFLATLNSRKRKSIRKERRTVCEQGIEYDSLEGAEIDDSHWNAFYRFYCNTYDMRGMQAYLSREFFQLLGSTMPENLYLLLAKKKGEYVAGALFFKSSDRLFGRYWGSSNDYPCLHFETCFYRGQEYCIEQGLKTFDPGAQGEHKILRGFEPTLTYSNHWIENAMFDRAIADFLVEDQRQVKRYMEEARSLLPYKKLDGES